MNIITIQERNPIDETPFVGIRLSIHGEYVAIGYSFTKHYKTLNAAKKCMRKRGYDIK